MAERNSRLGPACGSGEGAPVVSLRGAPSFGTFGAGAVVSLCGAGRVQRRIFRCFLTFPGLEMTTVDLARWCYPRLDGEPLRKHRHAIRRAALRMATRVRRDRPGGVVFRARSGEAETTSAFDIDKSMT
jgi:hypothetical protein